MQMRVLGAEKRKVLWENIAGQRKKSIRSGLNVDYVIR